jgi:LysM repeat protein
MPPAGNTTTPTPIQSPSQGSPGQPVEYTVVAGDTLSAIAARYGTTVDALMQLNGLTDPDLVNVGQVLTIEGDAQSNIAPQPTGTAQSDGLVLTPTNTSQPSPTRTWAPVLATRTPKPRLPTPTEGTAQDTPTVEAAATVTSPAQDTPEPAPTAGSGVMVDGLWYDAYVPAATKLHQYYHYTCEFDAAWVVLKTNGIDVTLQDQLAITGQDKSIEPKYEETSKGIFIYGGDILHYYSGDYTTNFLARTTGVVMSRVFEHYGLKVTPVHTQDTMEAALRQGQLVWIKTTADFKPGKPATWVMPDGSTYQTVLGNDHAAVVMGYSDRGAHIRDVLGPTSTNENRLYEYDVPWPIFMAAWDQQQDDGLAVGK